MNRARPRFWTCYQSLPAEARSLADRCFALLREDSRHPSLQLKKWDASGRRAWAGTTVRWRSKAAPIWCGCGLGRMRSMSA